MALSRAPFGEELARRVADRLKAGKTLGYAHREFCGDGLAYLRGRYQLHELLDGSPNIVRGRWTREDFIAFLARQSDWTCSRADPDTPEFYSPTAFEQKNQAIDEDRLRELVGDPPKPKSKPMDGVRRWLDRWLGPAR